MSKPEWLNDVVDPFTDALVATDVADQQPPNVTDAILILAGAVNELALQHESLVRAIKDLKK